MKKLLIILGVIAVLPLAAQDSLRKPQPNRIYFKPLDRFNRDSVPSKARNEIYFNIAPVFAVLIGALPSPPKWSVQYKRVLKNPRLASRFAFAYMPDVFDFYPYQNTVYTRTSDSTRLANTLYSDDRRPYQVNIGIEKRGKKYNYRWSTFFGADLMVGVYNRQYTLSEIEEYQLPNGQWTDSTSSFYGRLDSRNAMSWYAGISLNGGLRYAFNKRWMFSLQTAVDYGYQVISRYQRDSSGSKLQLVTSRYFGITTFALVNEFAIVLRF